MLCSGESLPWLTGYTVSILIPASAAAWIACLIVSPRCESVMSVYVYMLLYAVKFHDILCIMCCVSVSNLLSSTAVGCLSVLREAV